jgi:beta-lactamase superfamily II metal-dependent hydrolase
MIGGHQHCDHIGGLDEVIHAGYDVRIQSYYNLPTTSRSHRSDLGGGSIDNACTGRSSTQVDVETAVIQAISPGGAFPLISSGGIVGLTTVHF